MRPALETHHKIIGISDNHNSARCHLLAPRFDPQIEGDGPVAQDVIRLMKLENSGHLQNSPSTPEFPSQNVYFSATCISRIFVRVEVMVPKLELVMALSGLPQFGWFGKLNASNRNWSA